MCSILTCSMYLLFVDDHPGGCRFSGVTGCSSIPPQPRHEKVGLFTPLVFQNLKMPKHVSWEITVNICHLIDLFCVFTRVPAPVLMSKFSDTTKALMDVMSKQATSEAASALRWVNTFVSVLFVSFIVYCWKPHQRLTFGVFAFGRSCRAWPLCWGSRMHLSGLTQPLFRLIMACSASQCTTNQRSVSSAHWSLLTHFWLFISNL